MTVIPKSSTNLSRWRTCVSMLRRSHDYHREVPPRLLAIHTRPAAAPAAIRIGCIMIRSGSDATSQCCTSAAPASAQQLTMLAVALLTTIAVSFHFRRATPVLPLAIDRPASSHPRSPAEKAANLPRQKTGSVQIPIAPDAPPRHILRGFLPWRFADAGPRNPWRRHHGPASENLHKPGSLTARPAGPFYSQERTSSGSRSGPFRANRRGWAKSERHCPLAMCRVSYADRTSRARL